MPGQRSVRLVVLLVLVGMTATLGMGATVARAEYGEVGSPIEETGKVDESGPHGFGVDPTDNSFYVADAVPKTELYRIQKFSSSGQALAEVRFKANVNSFVLGRTALEGVVIDPEAKRLYLLEVQIAAEELDPEGASAAATLYAFSTEVKNSEHKLEPATGTKTGGVLAELKPQSVKTRVALLDPHGIAVDPVSGEVVIVGQEDEQVSGATPELRAAAQLIQPNGQLGARYVDVENCLDGRDGSGGEPACEEEGPGVETQPFSPVVAPSGKIYVERTGEVWELPKDREIGSNRFKTLPERLFVLGSEQVLLEFPGELRSEEIGSSMAFASTGPGKGRIYLTAGIASGGGTSGGVLALAYAELSGTSEITELGWTGGQNEASGEKCVLSRAGSEGLQLASAENEDVFVFDPRRHGLTGRPASVHVFEFGPGGAGCPHASATPPSVRVEEKSISPVPLGKTATLSSEVSEANAEGVEWKFKDLTTGEEEAPVRTGYQFQTTSLEHKFEHGGEYEVTEIIETDDFASPELEETQKVQVGAEHIEVEFSYPEAATVDKPAGFEAKVTDPHEPRAPHLEYVWKFGDGTEKRETTTSTEFSEEHTYQMEGPESVTLEVMDAHGDSGETAQVISVGKEESREERPNEEPRELPKEATLETPKAEGHLTSVTAGPQIKHTADAKLVSSSLHVNSTGAVVLEIACPQGESSCSGTVTLHTPGAVGAGAVGHTSIRKRKGVVVTLAGGSFSVAGGQVKALTLHLSAKARVLLERSHMLRAQATLVAHDPTGAARTTQTAVTLRAVAAKGRRKH